MALSRPPELGFNDFLAMLFELVFITAKLTRLFSSFTRARNSLYLLLYVDDIILTASSTSLLQRIISLLHAEFAMTDLGPLNYFLGISATRTTSGIFLSQTKYATEILEQAQMLNCNPCRTPIDTEKKLGPEGSSVTDPTLYRSLAGSLQYLTFTRPNLAYAVQQLCLYMHDPREPHLNVMKCVLRYLRGTTDLGLQLLRSTTSQLIAYSNADWAGQLSRSSAEAEYRGVANVWPIHHLDVKNAFLHGHLTETIYMHQLPGFTDLAYPDYVCLLQKSLYGLKHASRACFFYFDHATYHLFATWGICYNRPWPTQLFSRTPVDTEKKIGPEGSPVTDPTLYRSLAGALHCFGLIHHSSLPTLMLTGQDTLSRSSAEAEYRGVANAVAETSWIRNLLHELHTPLSTATLVYCDNVSAVYMSANPVQHQRTKHIKIDIHFVRDKVAAGYVRILHVPSRFQ
ncbi:ribonuclease H-like domain-containing protein [Tanacetum coccineum]|uniref:Ribonuclease H-like domain-containing protein n=1 Tax=Tanacetum coccineum TaxID=301880 RepID=A0ABQ5J794_9ASTR